MSEDRKNVGFDLTDGAAVLLLIVQATVAFYIDRFGPIGPIAVHFDLHGRPNGWGDHHALAMGVAVASAVTLLINLMLRLPLLTGGVGDDSRTNGIARGLILAASALVTTLLASLAFAPTTGLDAQRLPLIIAFLIFVVVGAFMGKASPNPFVGVRVYWTLRSRLAWDKANRLMGRILFFGGLIGLLATPFVNLDHDIAFVIAWLTIVAIGGSLLAIIESWRVWRADPERTP
jgi:uncharacterized membrane protein